MPYTIHTTVNEADGTDYDLSTNIGEYRHPNEVGRYIAETIETETKACVVSGVGMPPSSFIFTIVPHF